MPGEMLPEFKSIITCNMRVTSLRLDWGDGQQLLDWRKNAFIKFIIMNSIFIFTVPSHIYPNMFIHMFIHKGARQVSQTEARGAGATAGGKVGAGGEI